MGLDYNYEIFMPPQNISRALIELADLAPRGFVPPPLQIALPGREQVAVPFTSGFKNDPVDATAGGRLELETSIMFPVDDVIRDLHTLPNLECDALGRVDVGYIYLTVRFAPRWHPRFASLRFAAATSDMSRMFERSTSVRQVFTDLTAASGGVCCLLDTETRVFDICWLDGEPLRETVPGPRFARFQNLVAAWPNQVE